MARQEGVGRKLKVLYLMDYTGWQLKESVSPRLSIKLRKHMPHLDIDYAVAEGPYEDDQGDGAYFSPGKHKLSANKLELEVRRDVFVSMEKVLRAAHLCRPEWWWRTDRPRQLQWP